MSKEVENNNGTIIEFLLGEKSFNNAWFGDMIGGVQFWWRSELRKQSQQDKKRIKELEDELNNTRDLYSQSENQRVKLESKLKELKEVADEMATYLSMSYYFHPSTTVNDESKELLTKYKQQNA